MTVPKYYVVRRNWAFSEVLDVQAPDTPIPGGSTISPNRLEVDFFHDGVGWHLGCWVARGPGVDDQGQITEEYLAINGDVDFTYSGEHSSPGDPEMPPPEWLVELAAERISRLPAVSNGQTLPRVFRKKRSE